MNVLTDQLATLDVHPDDRDILDRILERFERVTADGCIVLSGNHGDNSRPQIGSGRSKMRVARFIVACRDDLNMRDEWDTRRTCNNRACVNLDHLRHGTRQQNALDRFEQGTAPVGDHAPNVKLTAEQVWQVLDMVNAGSMSLTDIAQRFECSLTTISNIKRGHTWRHIRDAWQENVHRSPRGGSAGVEVGSTGGQSDGR
ncbi:hypothetical protein [Ruegeria atlantica]|uniref:HNH nuclease domain-containing protein n=1 Tax=Ruegeria atlantica TaxID=81569 RepID=A0A0P1ECP6_9RHOB|nr:hypothetical protein [Ruegeria atlantica]CUH47438.1 hypothetical protein RUA4292_01608 [Ruegeria atlantica]